MSIQGNPSRCRWCKEVGHNINTCKVRKLRAEWVLHAVVDKIAPFAAADDRIAKTQKIFDKLKIRDLEVLVGRMRTELEQNESRLLATGQYSEDDLCSWCFYGKGCSQRLSALFSHTNITVSEQDRVNVRNHEMYGHSMVLANVFPGRSNSKPIMQIFLEIKEFQYDTSEKCPICLCNVTQKNVVSLSCSHLMCHGCMVKQLNSNLENVCALCRASICRVSIINKGAYDRLCSRYTFVGF